MKVNGRKIRCMALENSTILQEYWPTKDNGISTSFKDKASFTTRMSLQ